MKTKIKYSETFKQVLGLILVPLLYMGIFMFIIFSINRPNISELLWNIILFGGIFLVMGLCIYTLLMLLTINCDAEYDTQGIHFHLTGKSFLFPHNDFFVSYANIENAAMNEDSAGRIFISIKLKSPKKSIILTPEDADNAETFTLFWNGLEQQISGFNNTNSTHPAMLIKSKGFYESRFMRGSAYVSIFLAVLFTALKFLQPDAVPTWKLIVFYCYAVPFILTVFKSKEKSNESRNEK